DRLHEKPAGAGVVVEQRQDLVAHRRIVRGGLLDPAMQVGFIFTVEGGLEEVANPPLLLARHAVGSLNSRCSQARARDQRRFSVADDMPIASADSSMLKPAKYRSST